MKHSRPEQGLLTRDNDLSKTDETIATIDAMVDGLNDHDIDNMGRFFSESFRWMGNAGCGVKNGLKEFQENWQRPFQAAFSDKLCIDEARITQGEWCAAFGRQEAVHSGEFTEAAGEALEGDRVLHRQAPGSKSVTSAGIPGLRWNAPSLVMRTFTG